MFYVINKISAVNVKFWNPEILKTVGPWSPRTLQPWNRTTVDDDEEGRGKEMK